MRQLQTTLKLFLVCLICLPLSAGDTVQLKTRTQESGNRGYDRLVRQIQHELIMLPFLSLFDDLSFRVDDGAVTLLGYVSRPTLKTDSERVIKKIEGVEKIVNQIEVLPLSPSDDRIRVATARMLFGHPMLNRYALQVIPSIHIIVKNGNVSLDGTVDSENDRNVAGIEANSVPGVFQVKNNLKVVKPSK